VIASIDVYVPKQGIVLPPIPIFPIFMVGALE